MNPANGFTGRLTSPAGACGSHLLVRYGTPATVTLPATGSTNPSAYLTLSVTGGTAGTYNVTVTGTAGSQIHTLGVSAIVR